MTARLSSTFKYLRLFSTINHSDVESFTKLTAEWWNENGPLKPLHSMNTLRVPLIRNGLNASRTRNLNGLKVLDVGCGGGILSEPLARLGADVTGLDANPSAIEVATSHCQKQNLQNIKYLTSSIEDHVVTNSESYDAVVASEILEHVYHKESFVESCVNCLKPGGHIFITTLNSTLVADILAVQVAECIGLVPKGIHDVDKFIAPHEVQRILEKNNCQTELIQGMMYFFPTNSWYWISDTSINYALQAVKL